MNKITKNITALIALGIGSTTIGTAQVTQQKVGDNPTTISPSAVFEVESIDKGALLPRVNLTSLTDVTTIATPADALTVFNKATAGVAPNNVTPGYYYWSTTGNKWVRLLTSATEPWRIQTTTNNAVANTDDIYQTGKVGVGDFSGVSSTKKLEVKGDFKSSITSGGITSGIEIANTEDPDVKNMMAVMEENADLGVSGKGSIFFQDKNIGGMGVFDNLNRSVTEHSISKIISNKITGTNETYSVLQDKIASFGSMETSTTRGVNMLLNFDEGIKFQFGTNYNAAFQTYTFPTNVGLPNQVLTTNGTVPSAQLSWTDASTLVPEPWRIQSSTTPATTNAQDIYQVGKVAVGNFSGASSTKQFEVKGNFKSEVSTGGNIYGVEIDNPLIPGSQKASNYWLGSDFSYRVSGVHSNAAFLTAGTEGTNPNSGIESIVAADNTRVTMGSRMKNGSSKSEIRTDNTGNFFMESYNVANNFGSTFSLQDDGLRLVHTNTNGALDPFPIANRSEILVQKTNGVEFDFRDATGAVKANYWFPVTTGTNGQVMTQTASGKMVWSNPSTFGAANNGLTKNGTTGEFELGGTLNRTTTIATVNGATTHPLNITGLPTGAATDNIVVSSTGGQLKTIPASTFAAVNIYTNDGTLAGNRIVTTGSNYLRFTGNGNTVSIDNTGTTGRVSSTGTSRGSVGVIGGNSTLEIFADNNSTSQISANGSGSTGLSVGTGLSNAQPLRFMTNGLTRATITATGEMAIGAATAPSFTVGATTVQPKLHVAGDISTTGKIYTTNSVYADYVFEKYFRGQSDINPNYEFKSLNYVKDFIKANHHLPGVESIDDLRKAENGYTFDMTKLMIQSLEKIEELYLHTIEQKDKIDAQQVEIDKLKKEAQETNERLERLEKLLLENRK